MVRRISLSQFKNLVRQAEAKQKKAIDDYNRAVRDHNQKVNRAIDNYNREVRSYNARVRANRQRLQSELRRLASAGTSRTVTIRTSSQGLHRAFERVEARVEASASTEQEHDFLDLSERETANSVAAVNALEGQAAKDGDDLGRLNDTVIGEELSGVSADLDRRWRGALFALDPRNPDAARHFCTSAREVFTRFLEACAPDPEVLAIFPLCDRSPDGRPTRRTRIRLMLQKKGLAVSEYEEFVTQDVTNVLELFQVFNDGTHGVAGTYSLEQLRAVKRRVEDGILFLSKLVS